ncbi:50S ribosomal protein L9 [Candidatus Sumerlaeota bacterium]|nr:50S ribosomal protein L9 [Candidatus Sumerlaeota bacterium]
MKVILTRDVPEVGRAGTVKNVAPGYMRNYLFPRGLAVEATESNMRMHEKVRERAAELAEEDRRRAAELAEKIATFELRFTLKADEHGHLYGSVSQADVVKALEEQGVDVERRRVQLKEHIKRTGTHYVDVRLHGEIAGRVRVVVISEGPPKVEKRAEDEEAPAETEASEGSAADTAESEADSSAEAAEAPEAKADPS